MKMEVKYFLPTSLNLNFAKLIGNTCTKGSICKFCEIFKNTFFTEPLQITASEMRTGQM